MLKLSNINKFLFTTAVLVFIGQLCKQVYIAIMITMLNVTCTILNHENNLMHLNIYICKRSQTTNFL